MSLADVNVTLNIQSNVSYPVRINVLGNPYNPLDTSNAKTQYQYNLTGFTFTNETNIVIQYRASSSSTFSTFTQQLQSQNIQGVVNALNLLNIGSFQTYTELGQTYISTYNDNFVFGQLNIYAPSIINPAFFYGTGFNSLVSAIATQTDGKIICSGTFTTYNTIPVTGFIVRLNTDGSIDNTFVSGAGLSTNARAIAIQADGKILAVGGFSTYAGNVALGIVRINTDGSFDSTFVTGTGVTGSAPNPATVIAVQTDQKILIGGIFDLNYNGTSGSLIRINSNGTADGTFTAGAVNEFPFPVAPQITALSIQADGKIIIVGNFNSYGGSGVVGDGIIRVNSNGTYDASFATGTGFNLSGSTDVAIQIDQKIIVLGLFTDYNGTTCSNVIRLNTNGTVDSVFGTGFNARTYYVSALSNGGIIITGTFTNYNTVTAADGIVRLNSDTSVNTSWNYGTGFGGTGFGKLSLNSAQSLLNIGGGFTVFNGTPANRIIQLSL